MNAARAHLLEPLRTDRQTLARIEAQDSGNIRLLRVDDDEMFAAIQTFVRLLGEKREAALDDTIRALVDALGPVQMKDIEASVLMDNARLRREYLEEVETLSSEEVHALSGRSSRNTAETASRWVREGKVFAVKAGRALRLPVFQFADGQPRPEIARILAALPEYQRHGWPAAFWFASGHGYLGCAPQDALADPARAGDVVEAARQTGGVRG
ncbi:MAG: hypothetical protein H3C51_07265 [Rubellimicrobium sp.]|nr:hypothetical protein [Rubellimicrobium sp.]